MLRRGSGPLYERGDTKGQLRCICQRSVDFMMRPTTTPSCEPSGSASSRSRCVRPLRGGGACRGAMDFGAAAASPPRRPLPSPPIGRLGSISPHAGPAMPGKCLCCRLGHQSRSRPPPKPPQPPPAACSAKPQGDILFWPLKMLSMLCERSRRAPGDGCHVSEFTISSVVGVAALKTWYGATGRIALSYRR